MEPPIAFAFSLLDRANVRTRPRCERIEPSQNCNTWATASQAKEKDEVVDAAGHKVEKPPTNLQSYQ
eukprot:944899-Amphidinium_carterae.1